MAELHIVGDWQVTLSDERAAELVEMGAAVSLSDAGVFQLTAAGAAVLLAMLEDDSS